MRVTAKHTNSIPPQIVYPPGPIERQANTVPRGMVIGGGGVIVAPRDPEATKGGPGRPTSPKRNLVGGSWCPLAPTTTQGGA